MTAGLRAALLVLLLSAAPASQAARERGDGFYIDIPAGWAVQRDLMGVPLMARPDRSADAEGWGADLITVLREPADRRRTCLDAFVMRKLQQLAYHSARFEKLEEETFDLPAQGGAPATLLTLRYTEGPRELMAYMLVLDAGPHFLTATASSSPARFEFQRAHLRQTLETLRATRPGRGP